MVELTSEAPTTTISDSSTRSDSFFRDQACTKPSFTHALALLRRLRQFDFFAATPHNEALKLTSKAQNFKPQLLKQSLQTLKPLR